MPTYRVDDPATGLTLDLEGDSPPTEEELTGIFAETAKRAPTDWGDVSFKGLIPAALQAGQKAVGETLKGAAYVGGNLPIAAPPGVYLIPTAPTAPPPPRKSALQKYQEAKESPVFQFGQNLEDVAEETHPIPATAIRSPITKIGQAVGGFIAPVASGPLAPLQIGLQSFGQHLDEDFNAGVEQGMTNDEAADAALKRATVSGATQAAIWFAMPKLLRSATDKWIVDKFAPVVGDKVVRRFLIGRAAAVTEGAGLGAASQAGENIASGRPVGEGVPGAAAGMALIQGMMPRGRTPREVQDIRDMMGEPTPGATPPPNAASWAFTFGAGEGEPETAIRRPQARVLPTQPYVPPAPGPMGELPESAAYAVDAELRSFGAAREDIEAATPQQKQIMLVKLRAAARQGPFTFAQQPPVPPAQPTGEPNAIASRTEQESREPEHLGVSPGGNLPADQAQVRQEAAGQAGGGRGVEPGAAVGQAPNAPAQPVGEPPPPTVPEGTPTGEWKPAIRLMPERPGEPGEAVPGIRVKDEETGKLRWETHNEIAKRLRITFEDADQRGFLDPQNTYRTREQAKEESGFPAEFQEGRLHSTDLPEVKPVELMTVAEHREASGITKEKELKQGIGMSLVNARSQHKPLNAESVDYAGLPLPKGYVKDGDLYVFKSTGPAPPRRKLRAGQKPLTAAPAEPTVPAEAAPATITGSNERKGSEMSAEVGGESPLRSAAFLRTEIARVQADVDRHEQQVKSLRKGGQKKDANALKGRVAELSDQLSALKGELSRAELAEPKSKRGRGTSARRRFDNETEQYGDDILNWLVDHGGIMSATRARAYHGADWWRQNKSEWDGFSGQRLSAPHHYIIFTDRGEEPNKVASDAVREGKLREGDTSTELWEKILSASKKRRGNAQQITEEEFYEKEAAFKDAISEGKRKMQITSDDLDVGAMLSVGKEWFTVTKVDPDTGEVTINDGRKFGKQVLPSGKTLWIEKLKAPEAEDDGFPEPETPAVQSGPTASSEAVSGEAPPPVPPAPASVAETPQAPLPERPAQRPLTTKEKAEFQNLSLRARSARERGEAALTPEETRRYEYLTALAGQMDLLGEDRAASIASQVKQLEDRIAELRRAQQFSVQRHKPDEVAGYEREIDALSRQLQQVRSGEPISPEAAPEPPPEPDLFGPRQLMPGRAGEEGALPPGALERLRRAVQEGEARREAGIPSPSEMEGYKALQAAIESGQPPLKLDTIDDVRAAVKDPDSGLSDEHRDLLAKMDKAGLLEKYPGLRMEVADYIEGGHQGEHQEGFARFLRSAETAVPLHEFLHHVWDRFLPSADRAYIASERKAALMKVLNQFPDEHAGKLLSGMSSDGFIKAGLDERLYHLANDSEFFAWLMSRTGERELNKPEATTFVGKVRDFIKSLWTAVKDSLGLSAREDALWRKIVSGRAAYRSADGIRYGEHERQLSLARTPEQLEEQRRLESQIAPSMRAVGAYGDMARVKDKIARELDLSEGARKLINLPKIGEMYSTAVSDPQVAGIENYAQARAAVANANPTIRWNVTKDALAAYGHDQRRSIGRKHQLETVMEHVASPGFQKLMERRTRLQFSADLATEKQNTFRNTLLVQITDLNNQINAAKVDDARTDALHESVRQLQAMMTQMRPVTQAMDDIVSRLYPEFTENRRGGYWDPQRMDPTGMYAEAPQIAERFYQLYQRARAAEGNPLTNHDEITIAQLASKLLAANFNLTQRMVISEIWKREPDFGPALENFTRAFTERLANEPAAAIRELVAKGAKLATKADQARQAFLKVNKKVSAVLQRAGDLDQAVIADEWMKASPEWQAVVNQVNRDAEALQIPDSIKDKQINKSGEVFDEFHATMNAIDPEGRLHSVDIGFTPDSARAAQPKIRDYLQAVGEWLHDPAHEQHPDREFWQLQYDWHDALYNSLSTLDPSSHQSLIGFHPWSMPEFFFRQTNLPQLKILQKGFENWHRAAVQRNQWIQETIAPLMRALRKAVANQNRQTAGSWLGGILRPRFDTTGDFSDYRAQVLNHLAWAYRHGIAVRPGERLHGVTIHAEDIEALKAMGMAVQRLVKLQKNIGAERVMQPGWLIDEWVPGTFAIRQPQEFGAEPGTTVPREPSRRAARLCKEVSDNVPLGEGNRAAARDRLQGILDNLVYFEPFVMSWLGERSPDYSKATPFEHLFRELYNEFNTGGGDAPHSVDDVFNYITANSGADYTRDQIRESILDRMETEIRSFQERFFKPKPESTGNAASDIRVERATRDGPFTKGFERDAGSSFFYDYGMINAQEIFSMGIDASMYHTVRLVKALESADSYISELIKVMPEEGAIDRKEFMARQRDLFKRGEDFRDFETLQQQLAFVRMMRERLPIWGGGVAAKFEGLQNLYRLVGDEVSMKLGGLTTLARVFTGSIFKQGFVLSGLERSWVTSIPKATVSMAMSFARIGIGGPIAMAARRVGLMKKFEGELSGWAEEMFRFGHFFNQQYQFGLGTKTPTLDTIWNNLTMPYTHGRGYDPKFSDFWMLRLPQKAYYRALSVVEAPIEALRVMLPSLGYAVAYDSVARQIYWGMKGLELQARKAFDYHEKRGTLSLFDLENPTSLQNKLNASEILPRGIMPKTATQLAQIREMFNRGTDMDLQEVVMRYWRALRDSAPGDARDNIRMFGADASTPEQAKQREEARLGALASIGLFDIHHASPANRPWAMRESPAARLVMPIAGWFIQSTRQIPALLGKAPFDPKYSAAMMTALTFVGMCAFAAWADLTGDAEKRIFDKLKWIAFHQIDPVKHAGMGRDAVEEAKIHVSNITGYITILNSIFNALLGEQTNRGAYGAQVFVGEMINSALSYVSGVAHTHDITYGLPQFLATQAPITKIVTSRLPSQEGITNERNARTIVQRYAPQELLRQATGGYGLPTPTELSPIKQRLANAIYRGDSIGVVEAYQDFLDTARKLGRTDPETLAGSVIRSLNPYSLALVEHPTEAQRAEMLSKLNPHEQQLLQDAETNFMAASQMLGVGSEMVRKEPGEGGGAREAAATGSVRGVGMGVPRGTMGGGTLVAGATPRIGGFGARIGHRASGLRRATLGRLGFSRLRVGRLRATAPRSRAFGRFSGTGVPKLRHRRRIYA